MPQFVDFIHCMVFYFIFYCETMKTPYICMSHSTSGFPRTDFYQTNRRHLYKWVTRPWVSCYLPLGARHFNLWDLKRSWRTSEENRGKDSNDCRCIFCWIRRFEVLNERYSKLNVVFTYCAMKSEFSFTAKPFQEMFVFRITVVNTHSGFTIESFLSKYIQPIQTNMAVSLKIKIV